MRRLKIKAERFELVAPFRISRGERRHVDLVMATIAEAGVEGAGESSPSSRYGEDAASVIAEIERARTAIEAGANCDDITRIMPAGAARNAVDCGLWALDAAVSGVPTSIRLGTPDVPIVTALTIQLGTPMDMARTAASLRDRPLLKIKVDGERPADCIAAVRQAAPAARLIVDANESWTIDQLRAMEPLMVDLGIELIEQPLPAAADESLCDHVPAIPIAADEALRTRADLPNVVGRYQVATIKLDKAGGLTEALATAEEASAAGLKVMTGCMLCSSLSVAAARHLATRSDLVDLDGPTWLRTDRPGGFDLKAGWLHPA